MNEGTPNMVKHIIHEHQLIAIIIPAEFKKAGIEFFTPNDFSQQLAYMNRPSGYKIPPHVHRPVKRSIVNTLEVLYIKKGKVKIDFYTQDRAFISDCILNTGDVILLAAGGHGFTMLEDSEMIEIKQGPYAGDADKVRFEGI